MQTIKYGIVLKIGNKYIQQVWRRGHFDRDHLILKFVEDIKFATVYESVPEDLSNYRGIDLKTIFEKTEKLSVVVTTTRNVILETKVEILNVIK